MRIDVSLGLEIALPMLAEHYHEDAILQAKVTKIPGFRGQYQCQIQLHEGKVVSCYLEGKDGKRHHVDLALLVQADKKRGPFEWALIPQPQTSPQLSPQLYTQPQPSQPSQHSTQPQLPQLYAPPQPPHSVVPSATPPMDRDAIPIRLRQELDLSWLSSMGRPQQILLRAVFNFIDGQRSVAEIKAKFPHVSEDKIEQIIIFLMATHFATFRYEEF